MKRIFLLAAILCGLMLSSRGEGEAFDELTPQQKAAVDDVLSVFLRDEEGAVAGASRMRRALEAGLVAALFNDLADSQAPEFGNADGDVTMIEFFDYQCGYCRAVFAPLMETVADDGGVRLVVKELPVLGEASVIAARAALAAHRMGKYPQFHRALVERRGRIDESALREAARIAELNWEQLQSNMNSGEIETELARNNALANILGVRGTPAFVVGDEIVRGAVGAEVMRELIAQARRR